MKKPAGSEKPLGQDWSSLIQKQISRRGLLKGGLLAGLGIPMASTVLTPHGRSSSRIKSSSGGKTVTVASYGARGNSRPDGIARRSVPVVVACQL